MRRICLRPLPLLALRFVSACIPFSWLNKLRRFQFDRSIFPSLCYGVRSSVWKLMNNKTECWTKLNCAAWEWRPQAMGYPWQFLRRFKIECMRTMGDRAIPFGAQMMLPMHGDSGAERERWECASAPSIAVAQQIHLTDNSAYARFAAKFMQNELDI